jgi:protein phosphatase
LTRWRYASATDTGYVRESNQDALFVDNALAIVADGMGGHAAGEVASAMTVETIYQGFLANATVDALVRSFDAANREVLSNAKANPERFGMGTTALCVALLDEPGTGSVPVLFHVGDSRAYQLRDGALKQLTQDHSVAEEWVRMGRLTPEEALVHPRRHQLTRAIGVDQPLEIDVQSLSVQVGDRVLLCSDGLSNELTSEQIAVLASADLSLDEVVQSLVLAAKNAGGRDNISAVIVEFDEVVTPATPINRVITPLPPAPPPAEVVTALLPSRAKRQRRVVTWRTCLAVLVLAGVGWGFVAIMRWYAYSNFYIASDAGHVVIYQGQPGGVLWYKPHVAHVTRFQLKDFRTADQEAIRAIVNEPSQAAAVSFLTYLHGQYLLSVPTTTTTVRATTTTTTVKKVAG